MAKDFKYRILERSFERIILLVFVFIIYRFAKKIIYAKISINLSYNFLLMKTKNIKKERNFYKNFLSKTFGFTLVELIIVITILAILATIAFISFKNYSGNARDGNRIATLKNIETWIELYSLKTWTPPQPEWETIQIMWSGTTASWTLLWTKWELWETISKQIKMNKLPFDPYT